MSHELVGRPLIPFFDQHDNINAALACNDTLPFEKLDIDARVWNKKLGYFEYPSSVTSQKALNMRSVVRRSPSTKRSNSTGRNQKNRNGGGKENVCSGPITILSRSEKVESQYAQNNESMKTIYDQSSACSPSSLPCSFSSLSTKCLLTPQMLSTSCPVAIMDKPAADFMLNEAMESVYQHGRQQSSISRTKEQNEAAKKQIDSIKRASKEKKHQQKTTHGNTQRKTLSAGEKWAWSAFQTSPEPDKLPLPPFIVKPKMMGSFAIPTIAVGVLAEPHEAEVDALDANKKLMEAEEEAQPPLPPPPLGKGDLGKSQVFSIEQSMTQDLCRMLNIG
uniref:AlNc14C85G5445 protein n=1 Tax=Albugo laibachii Nc14 TaxID=890382 RepID=F0WFR0_9STRA|nr:AlNc14C85G5445 [Albugo laibachii Nc14]|eukprot:CCA20044.1 AlNc14C85G5445 [Albugo laibachii Nc14]